MSIKIDYANYTVAATDDDGHAYHIVAMAYGNGTYEINATQNWFCEHCQASHKTKLHREEYEAANLIDLAEHIGHIIEALPHSANLHTGDKRNE